LLFAAASLVHGGGDDKDKGKAKGKLEGAWVAEKDGIKVELTFAKDMFTVVTPEGKTIKGTYKTDVSKKPMHMDMTVKEGDAEAEGKTALCIYELDGDKLKWCANDPVKGNERLKDFPDKEGGGPGHIYLVFKRAGK